MQSTRIPSGALTNFFLHLDAGELNDARAYFAPGLVTSSAELDKSLETASDRLRRYQIERKGSKSEDLTNGEQRVTLLGRVRSAAMPGMPNPGPDEGWQETNLITARMVERGPGWRILDFELECCP